jgi:hypothetical protein
VSKSCALLEKICPPLNIVFTVQQMSQPLNTNCYCPFGGSTLMKDFSVIFQFSCTLYLIKVEKKLGIFIFSRNKIGLLSIKLAYKNCRKILLEKFLFEGKLV